MVDFRNNHFENNNRIPNLEDEIESISKNIDLKLPKIIKKIPGEIQPLPKKSSQGYIEDLKSKEVFELKDLLERQNKLLSNKNFILKLPDKGAKIKQFKEKIELELRLKEQVENAGKLLSKLNIAAEGKIAMSEIEWTGKYSENSRCAKVIELDSDDEQDPLRILAQPTGSGTHKKKITYLPPEESLIKPSDLEDIEELQNFNPLNEEHVKFIVERVENHEKNKERSFKPFYTTKSNVHDPEKEKFRKQNKHWEITAATPPPVMHGAVKTLDLSESLKLQKEYENKIKEIQAKHAAEKLTSQIGKFMMEELPKNFGNYRTRNDSESTLSEHEDYEVHDDEDNDKAGTVVYTIETEES